MRPKLVAVDLDGTLIDRSLRVPPSAAAAGANDSRRLCSYRVG